MPLIYKDLKAVPPCPTLATLSMPLPPPGWPVYGVNSQCLHNEVLALQNRVLCPLGPISVDGLWETMIKWLPSLHLAPATSQQVLDLMNKASRRKYRRFLAQPRECAPSGRIRLFTKMERIPIVKRGKPKAPRAIQTRSMQYHWSLAQFTKPLEHHLYAWKVLGKRVIAKGLNLEERANLLRAHMQPGMVCMSLDATDWDGHCSTQLLKLEHRYYLQCFQYDPHLRRLLRKQLQNHGFTLCGVAYRVEGSRMSGDMNTALGNCVLAASLALHAVERLAPGALEAQKASVVCDGDDTLLFLSADLLGQFTAELPRLYQGFGHQLRVDSVADTLQDIEFCQHKPMLLSNGRWTMVPDPRKVLQTAFMATGANAFSLPYYGTLWDCRARIHSGVPVYAALFRRLAVENPARLACEHFFGFEHADPGFRDLPVTEEQRIQFAQAWDFDVSLQLAWEQADVSFADDFMGDPATLGNGS